MKIAVVGTGYVGLVSGVCLSSVGHEVVCVDIDEAKVNCLRRGEVPIYEPGLEELLDSSLKAGRLQFTTELSTAVTHAQVLFLALPTPPGADGSADLSAVLKVADQLGKLIEDYTVVVDKSTVPVGTAEQVAERLQAGGASAFDVVSNPEFLREGLAVQDFMHPDRIVIGTSSDRARQTMTELYESFVDEPAQLVCMDVRSAEMTKYAANSFLALKVSFMNEIANVCEKVGADVEAVRLGIGPDQRIGHRFLLAGIGFGGSCFPKDVQALKFTAQANGYQSPLLEGILAVNTAQKKRLVQKLREYFNDDITGKHIGLWGLAFKPDTDDIREAPALDIIADLLAAGATVSAYDPEAATNVRKVLGDQPGLSFADTALKAANGADALLIATEWEEFRAPDFTALKAAMKQPVVFDGRNIYQPQHMRALGFYYAGIGRPV